MMRGFFPGGFGSYGGFGNYGYNMMGGFWWVGLLAHALVWIVLIWLVVWIIRKLTGTAKVKAKDDEALAIVRERYAKGEITKEDYDQLSKDLK